MFADGLAVAERFGITPRYRHIANSAATLTRPDAHFDLVRPGIAIYGLSPDRRAERYGLRPAMTARARVALIKRVPAGQGVSYGHSYHTERETTLALVPLGLRRRGAPARLERRPGGAGRDDPDHRRAGLHGPDRARLSATTRWPPATWRPCSARRRAPTADDWAEAVGTINYEIVTRFGGSRVPRVYDGEAQ